MRNSFYRKMMNDESSVYFTEDFFDIKNDGSVDVTCELQKAINQVVDTFGYGVVFVPEGKYLLSGTIYVPKAVRVIGYGETRPQFILKDGAEGFNEPVANDKGHYKYLFWFVNEKVKEDTNLNANDANPGTFYSAMSNVDVDLGKGNRYAVAFRTHYAQHCFLAHIHINVNSGMAGIYDVGNEMEDIAMTGGKYGIITTKCSPGWPFVMVDTYFENQEVAAIKTREAGLNIIRTHVKDTPKFIDVDEGYFEKLYIEDSMFENVNVLMHVAMDNNPMTQINVRNCYVTETNVIAEYKETGRVVESIYSEGLIKEYIHGIVANDLQSRCERVDKLDMFEETPDFSVLETDLKKLPPMERWTNVKYLGLVGDGVTDDTALLKKAVAEYEVLYFPQGEYILSEQIKLKKNTVLIGMNPVSTQLILKDNSENFTGFGKGIGFIESADDGENILFGLGINTGGRNPRAIALKWIGSGNSYVNDVKLFGGHGNLEKGTGRFEMPYNATRTADVKPERLWDYQYPSVVINGGGIFKDIWSASPYVTAGIYIENSHVDSKVYCMSLEHHGRYELRMKNSSNWTFYGFQTEEEVAEGEFARPIELMNCSDITFATAYHFRTIFVKTPYDYCVKTFNCKNIEFLNVHNYSQMKYTIDNFLLDVNSGVEIRNWQAAKVHISGECNNKREIGKKPVKLFSGFRFPDGGICDSKGNFYFVDSLDKKVYRIDGETMNLDVVFESPYKVNSVGVDTEDNVIVAGEYVIPKDATINGVKQENILPPDSFGTSYGFWYNRNAMTIVFAVDANGEIKRLEEVEMKEVNPERVLYPGNRWRDGSDFMNILTYDAKKAWMAPDGKTIIPMHYDLIRANNLGVAVPGEKFYSVDEMYKRVCVCDVDEHGYLSNVTTKVETGDYCVRAHRDALYVGAENIEIYSGEKHTDTIEFSSRPLTFDIGGRNKEILFATARDGVYVVEI